MAHADRDAKRSSRESRKISVPIAAASAMKAVSVSEAAKAASSRSATRRISRPAFLPRDERENDRGHDRKEEVDADVVRISDVAGGADARVQQVLKDERRPYLEALEDGHDGIDCRPHEHQCHAPQRPPLGEGQCSHEERTTANRPEQRFAAQELLG
jgi:hypothetical protein